MTTFDPERLLKALARRRVRYVLIGAAAARLRELNAAADIARCVSTPSIGEPIGQPCRSPTILGPAQQPASPRVEPWPKRTF